MNGSGRDARCSCAGRSSQKGEGREGEAKREREETFSRPTTKGSPSQHLFLFALPAITYHYDEACFSLSVHLHPRGLRPPQVCIIPLYPPQPTRHLYTIIYP